MFSRKIKTIIFIDGMSCEHCSNKVKSTLLNIDGVKKVKVNLSLKTATVWHEKYIDESIFRKEIDNLDYKVIDIKESI